MNLLNAAKTTWQGNYEEKRFYHISTEEVYGSLGAEGLFTRQLTIPIRHIQL
jgi:dTDP-glucose 4,6-dehydratase